QKTPPEPTVLQGEIQGNNASVGHRVRAGGLPAPTGDVQRRKVLIIGGGIAGLSAAWRLAEAGVDGVEVLELGEQAGGTSRAGRNDVSAFPWGAHYLPVPNPESRLVRRLCRDMGLVNERGVFDARQLVAQPEDRVFFRGKWYPGLYLGVGSAQQDKDERHRFDGMVGSLRKKTGMDGLPLFAIPVALSSNDPETRSLDTITAASFLDQQKLVGERIRAYVRYGCRDDYGADLDQVSAWAMLHYFCGRRPIEQPETKGTQFLTWPEGNAHIVAWLRDKASALQTGMAAYKVQADGQVQVLDAEKNRTVTYQAEQVICATPNHVTHAITQGGRARVLDQAPWLVVNLTLRERPGEVAWNNVIHDDTSVGFVDAGHQRRDRHHATVWTWYEPMLPTQRGALLSMSWQTAADRALDNIRRCFPRIRDVVQRADVWRWGHGTVIPKPGLIHGRELAEARAPMGRVHFAHTDLSGLPLFEEAQYRGVLAAEASMKALGVPFKRWA
ncbi:MAG: phytoene dehydrogenase-like protein, partial [Myxococcota bacterium]